MNEIISKNYAGQTCILVYSTTQIPVKIGSMVREYLIEGGSAPHRSNSTGRVLVKEKDGFRREFFPSVLNTEWRIKE